MITNKPMLAALRPERSSQVAAVIALLALLSCSAGRPDAKSVLTETAKAMGATNLRTIEFSGSDSQFVHGQPLVPYDELPRFNAKSFNYVADYTHHANRRAGR
jgi:hypothetical protein